MVVNMSNEEQAPEHETQDEAATSKMRTADERLKSLEERIGGDSEHGPRTIDYALRELVQDVGMLWNTGKMSTEKAGEMILMAIGQIDNYKDDDDPSSQFQAEERNIVKVVFLGGISSCGGIGC